MNRGGGKQKGGEFERTICKQLSLWVSKGASIDLFWRSAMSGGRATVKRGQVRQAGDICAVAPEGHVLTDRYYIECKFYKDLTFDCFVSGKGTLIDFWKVAFKEAMFHEKIPMLIFKRNHWPILVCTLPVGLYHLGLPPFLEYDNMNFVKFDDMIAKGQI